MKNYNLLSKILFVVATSLFLILSIVLLATSFESYDDGWGIDFSFNKDYLILVIVGIALTTYEAYTLYAEIKNKELNDLPYYLFGTLAIVGAGYNLGVFFKAVAKGKDYLSNQMYLYFGLVCLVLVIAIAFKYLAKKNNKENN